MQRFTATLLSLCLFTSLAVAEVKTENVDYQDNGTVMKGYLAYDDSIKGKRPGVLVVHEWWGHNDYARKRARMLAKLGYTALALDMYGDGKVANHPQDAKAFMMAVKSNMAVAKKRFEAAMAVLKGHANTDAGRIAAIGYCFGGGIVLEMARRGVDLKGVVSFHGSLGTGEPAKKGAVKAKVMVHNGADDPFVKPEAIAAFKAEMEAAGVDYEFFNHKGAMHAFTNPDADAFGKKFNMPLAYDAASDKTSWAKMQGFFKTIFK